jgi:hypothetical protein
MSKRSDQRSLFAAFHAPLMKATTISQIEPKLTT